MPLNEAVSHQATVDVDGRPLPPDVAALLESVVVDDSALVPDLALLRFRDVGGSTLSRAGIRIGSAVTVRLSTHNARERAELLKAEVTALECEADVDGVHVVVRALDRTHRMLAGRRVEAYLNMSASDVVRQVAQRAGVRIGQVDTTRPVYEQVSQDGVSDWDFLRRLALEHGRELRVENEALFFVDPAPAQEGPAGNRPPRDEPLALAHGQNLEQLRAVVTSSGLVPGVEVRGWDPVQKRAVVGTATATATSAELPGTTPGALASLFGAPTLVHADSSYRTAEQVDTVAKALAARVANGFAEVEGRARGNASLRTGKPVTVSGLGAPFDGKYTLSSTRHEWTPERGYVTWFTASGGSERSLYATAGAAPAAGAVPHGPVTGLVSDIKDPERLGRVKVTFPVLSGTYKSTWARVVSAGGGSGRGAVLLPEVNDEVLVLFGMGRMDEPYVLGGLHNGKDKAHEGALPAVQDTRGQVQRRAFVSRTGMVAEMVEGDQDVHVTLSNLGGRQKVSIVEKPDKKIEIVSEGAVQVRSTSGDVSVETNGNVSLSGTQIAVKAKGALTLEGATVSVKGTASAELKAATVKVAGDATAELSGGATTTVRGAVVRIN